MALGGIIAAGVRVRAHRLVVHGRRHRWIERLMPPVVTGAVVAVIGLNLAPIADQGHLGGSDFDTAGSGSLTVLAVGLVAVHAPGMARRLPILLGGDRRLLVYLMLRQRLRPRQADRLLRRRRGAAGSACRTSPAPVFTGTAMALIAPVAIILVAENLGHIKAVGGDDGAQPRPLSWAAPSSATDWRRSSAAPAAAPA